MSSSEAEGEETRPRREVAHRVFAAEFDDATLSYSESDEERAPNYVVTPTGARANRLFVAGVLTELEELGNGQLRARIADPTGVFVVYAGQYQPEALAALERLDTPAFLALTGKARTFQPEDSDRVFTSIRPESISEIDAATRDRWIVETSARTLDRIAAFAAALADGGAGSEAVGVVENTDEDRPDGSESGIALARGHYGTSTAYLAAIQELALDAARLVADEIEELRPPDVAPGAAGETDPDSLVTSGIEEKTVAALADDEKETPASGAGASEETSRTADMATADEEPTVEEATNADDVAGSSASATEVPDSDPEPVDSSEGTDDFGGNDAFGGGEDGDAADDGEDIEEFEGEFDLSEEERAEIEAEYGTGFTTGSEVEKPGEADIEPTASSADGSEDRLESGPTSDVAATGDAEDEPVGGSESAPESARDSVAEAESGPDPDFETGTEPESEPETGSDATEPGGRGDSEDGPGVESVGVPGSTTEAGAGGAEAGTDPEATSDELPSDEGSEPVPGESEAGATEADTDPEPADVDVTEAVMDAMRALDDGDGADRGAVIERVGEEYGISEAAADEAIQDALLGGRCYEPGENRLKAI
jgi:RPA family protein